METITGSRGGGEDTHHTFALGQWLSLDLNSSHRTPDMIDSSQPASSLHAVVFVVEGGVTEAYSGAEGEIDRHTKNVTLSTTVRAVNATRNIQHASVLTIGIPG